jgi:hypothetical protein
MGMVRPVKIALIAAIPIAVLNLPPTFAIDVGLPADANWFLQFIAAEWVVMHWLGIEFGRLDPYYHYLPLDIFVLYLSSYIEWALVLIAAFYAFLGLRRFSRGLSANQG